jgi:hypothetical protein
MRHQMCTFAVTPERTCPNAADVVLDGEELCADHLWELYPAEAESGHADSIPGVQFVN